MKLWQVIIRTLLILSFLGGLGNVGKAEIAGFYLKGNVKKVRIKVEVQNNVILLPLRINNSFVMNFILDTGVKTTILTEPNYPPLAYPGLPF